MFADWTEMRIFSAHRQSIYVQSESASAAQACAQLVSIRKSGQGQQGRQMLLVWNTHPT